MVPREIWSITLSFETDRALGIPPACLQLQTTATDVCETEATKKNKAGEHDIWKGENLLTEYAYNYKSYSDCCWEQIRSQLLDEDSERPVYHIYVCGENSSEWQISIRILHLSEALKLFKRNGHDLTSVSPSFISISYAEQRNCRLTVAPDDAVYAVRNVEIF